MVKLPQNVYFQDGYFDGTMEYLHVSFCQWCLNRLKKLYAEDSALSHKCNWCGKIIDGKVNNQDKYK